MEHSYQSPKLRRRRKRLSSNKRGTTDIRRYRSRRHGKWCLTVLRAFSGLLILQIIVLFVLSVLPGLFTATLDLLRGKPENRKHVRHGAHSHNKNTDSNSHFSVPILNSNFTTPLDNYKTRQHISLTDEAIADGKERTELPVLVVGGSDGSGTRAFVDILGKLGVPMLIDDTGTLDVHARCMFDGDGWPALVRTVFQTIQHANYSWDNFSVMQQTLFQTSLDAFVKHYGQRGNGLRQHGLKQGFPLANKVLYGFKAPVSMLVLPILQRAYKRIKFLHIVRDGRDVSLSKNKSPVQKFYHGFYPDASKRRRDFESIIGDFVAEEAMAIQLWNDWNAQVLDWEQKHSDGDTFDYLVMRAEDFMDPRTRLSSIRQLADFVGSNKTESELCCLSKQKIKDMGQSGVRIDEIPEPTWWERLYHSVRVWLRRIRVYLGLSSSASHARGRNNVVGSAERLTDEEDLPMPFDMSAIEIEHRAVKEGLKQRRPDLFRRMQLRRERRFDTMNELSFGGRALKNEEDLNSRAHRRLFDERMDNGDDIKIRWTVDHGDGIRIPWREQETKPPRAIVDHVQLDTMIERVREIELMNRREMFMRKKGLTPAELEQHVPPEKLESPEQVMKRYGKWRDEVEDRPELKRVLFHEGAQALRLFGYEPRALFSDTIHEEVCEPSTMCRNPDDTHPHNPH